MNAIRKVGMLGLGKMGAPMARHLIAKGYNVTGYDPAGDARRAAAGVSIVDSPREVTKGSDLVIVVVGFDHEVEADLARLSLPLGGTVKEAITALKIRLGYGLPHGAE